MDIKSTVPIPLQPSTNNTREKIFALLNISVPVLTSVFLFFNPFSHTTAIKEICFYFSLSIVLILILAKKTVFSLDSPLTLPFTLFVIWSFCGLFFALDRVNSIHDFYANLIKYLALYYIIINFFNSRKRLTLLSWTIIVSSGIFSLGGILYFYLIQGNPLYIRMGFNPLSINYLGFVTVFSVLLSLHMISRETHSIRKTVLLVCLLTSTVATLLTQTRANIVALIISLILLMPRNKKAFVIFFPVLIIGFLIAPGLTNRMHLDRIIHNERIGMYLTTIEVVKAYPILGIGFGMDTYGNKNLIDLRKYNEMISPEFRQKKIIPSTHNSWLDIAVRTGLVGLALFLLIIATFVKMGWQLIRDGTDEFSRDWALCTVSAMIAVSIQGMFVDGMFGPQVIVLYTIFAMMTISWKVHHNKSKVVR